MDREDAEHGVLEVADLRVESDTSGMVAIDLEVLNIADGPSAVRSGPEELTVEIRLAADLIFHQQIQAQYETTCQRGHEICKQSVHQFDIEVP